MAEEVTRGIDLGSFETGDSMGPTGTNHLLAIAIDEYVHCPVLHNCLKDAHGFIEVLKERYEFSEESITTLFNEEATRANIHARLKELKERVQPQDSVLIYFSGHGETEDNVGYWVPVEAHPSQEWEFVSTNDIKSRLDAINSFHTFVIVDACFSGSLFASYRSVKAGNENRRSRLGLAASHSRERALDGTAGENSPFSQNLLRKLRENTGILSAHKLAAELIEEVHAATRGKQTPVFKPLDVKGDDSGQFVFRLKADEGRDWKACQQAGTLAAYEAFLVKYPEGQHAGEAQEQVVLLRDEEAWQSAKDEHTVGAYFRYRQENPDGRYRDEALATIQQLEEDQSWHQAQRKDTIYEYEHYLEKYPAGRYAQDAQDALQALLGGHAQAVKPKAAEPLKQAPPPKVEKPRPQPARPAEAKVEKAAPAAGEEKLQRPAAATAAPINRKHLMIGGGVLIIAVLVIWAILSGGSQADDPATMTMTLYESNGKYGYRDNAGKEIAALYEKAEPFRDGRARVTLNGQTFTIDETGKCIADCPEAKDNAAAGKELLAEKPATTPAQQPSDTPRETAAESAPKESREAIPPAKKPAASLGAKGLSFDGKAYPVLRVGGLTWMAQNLDYQVPGSWCYGGNAANCQKYGRLYTWAAAKKACAAMGWRLPASKEWGALAKQSRSSFSPQLGGWRDDGGSFKHLGDSGYYWSNTENALGLIELHYFTSGEVSTVNNDPRLGFSCRCVQ